MPTSQPANFNLQEFTDVGQLLVGGRLYTYAYGTTAQKIAYTDPDGMVPHTYTADGAGGQYIALNARGELPAPLYLGDGSYDLTLKRIDGTIVWTRKVDGVNNFTADQIAALQGKLGNPSGAGLVGFLLTSAAAVKRWVQDKLQERPSVLDFMTDAQRADVLSNTGSIDVTAAVQAAFDAYVDPEVPSGRYKTTKPLVISSALTLRGRKRKAVFTAGADFIAGNVTRTYTDANGVAQNLTWNDKALFYLVCPANSYLTDVVLDELSFDLPADGSIGLLNAQRVAHSKFSNLYCSASAYFVKGYDMWMIKWTDIRSRYSKDHFDINTGTSNKFTNVHCDQKIASGGTGFTLTNMHYVEMDTCGADSLDRCYYFDSSTVAMSGCGAESFSRILQAKNGSSVTVNGGELAIYKAASFTGVANPYQLSDAGTKVTMDGTWLGIRNPTAAGGTYAAMVVETGAEVVLENIRYPIEIGGGTLTTWWGVTGTSVLSLLDKYGMRHITAYGVGRLDGVTNVKAFEYTKTIAAGSAQSILRIDNAGYGTSCFGQIELYLFNDYNPDFGFCGWQLYAFSAFKETSISQGLTKLGDSITPTNTSGAALGVLTAAFVRNADNTIDLQLNVPAAFGSTKVIAIVKYMNQLGGNQTAAAITGV